MEFENFLEVAKQIKEFYFHVVSLPPNGINDGNSTQLKILLIEDSASDVHAAGESRFIH